MARIRTIKPEFWTSEQVMECSLNARLMFIGMWNFADDTGRMPHSAKSIKAKVFPSDDISLDAIRGMLRELSSNGLILVYAVEDQEFLQITGWHHQRIDKPQASKCPAPFFDDSGNAIGTLHPDRIGRDSKVKEKNLSVAAAPANDDFEKFWKTKPRRAGADPKAPAEKLFRAAVKSGVPAETIIAAAKRWASTDAGKIGTEYLPQAVKWLRDKRWQDYPPLASGALDDDDGLIEVRDEAQLAAWDAYGRAMCGKPYPRDKRGGWRLPSKWPPGYEENIVAHVQKLVSGAS